MWFSYLSLPELQLAIGNLSGIDTSERVRERETTRERERLTEIGTEIERQRPNHVLENYCQPCVVMYPGLIEEIGRIWKNFPKQLMSKRLCSTYFADCWCPRPSGLQYTHWRKSAASAAATWVLCQPCRRPSLAALPSSRAHIVCAPFFQKKLPAECSQDITKQVSIHFHPTVNCQSLTAQFPYWQFVMEAHTVKHCLPSSFILLVTYFTHPLSFQGGYPQTFLEIISVPTPPPFSFWRFSISATFQFFSDTMEGVERVALPHGRR